MIYRKRLSEVIALAGVAGLLAMNAPASWGAPGDAGTVTDSLTLALSDLGSAPTLSFWGLTSSETLTVPILHGLAPVALNATVELPVNLRSGLLTVTQDERSIARLNLPTADQTPIAIPLDGAEAVNNTVTVTIRAYLLPQDGYCFDQASPLRLANGTVTYTGVEQPPTTVAHFLPPVLRKLTIFVPQSPSLDESDAAVQLATATAAHYGRQDPEIAVVPMTDGQTAPPTPPEPLERQVVIKEGSDYGLSLQGASGVPWLLVSGPLAHTDESDTAVLFSDLSQLALSSRAVVASLKSNLQLPGDTTTLREIGQPFANSVALQPRISIGLDQTRFGRSVHAMRMHLQGSYSPTPANIGGQIVVTVGSETIDHWPTDGKGSINHWVDIPDRVLQRYTSVDVMLNVADNAGHCGDFYIAGPGDHLLTLTVNGDSIVQSSPATPPVPDGLRSMPQALTPRVQVGIEPRSFSDTVRAATIMVGLQRISAVPLETTVMGVQQAIDSPNPGVLISAGGWNHSNVVLPVSAGPSGPVTVNAYQSDGKPTTLTLDPVLRFGSLQAVFNRGRSLLVATSNGTSAQLDELLRWLSSDNKRWQRLQGVAVVSAPGQDPATVDHSPTFGLASTSDSHSDLTWLWWFGAGWAAVAAVGAGVIVLRNWRGARRR